jgi:hypothetical protein
MEGTKHAKVVEDVSRKKGFATSTLLIVQRGKLSTSSKIIPKNQNNLYGWLKFNNSTNIVYHLEVRLILSLVCCVGVVGPRIINMLQTKLLG